MNLNKHRRQVAVAVTLLVHSLIALGLYYIYMEQSQRLPQLTELEVVPLELSAVEGLSDGGGQTAASTGVSMPEPQGEVALPTTQPRTPIAPVQSPSKPSASNKLKEAKAQAADIQTQMYEESLRQSEAKRRAQELERQKAEAERQRAEAERQEQEAKKKAEAARRAEARVASAFGAVSEATNSGANLGVSESATPHGVGKAVGAGSHSLAGRSITSNGGRLTTPTVRKAVRGRINVRIVVDASGRVISAEVTPTGTNIVDAAVRAAAVSAARQTEFNAQPEAMPQKGVITYNFEIQ